MIEGEVNADAQRMSPQVLEPLIQCGNLELVALDFNIAMERIDGT